MFYHMQIHNSSDPGHTFDLYLLVVLPGLSYRRYSLKIGKEDSNQGTVTVGRSVNFGRQPSNAKDNGGKTLIAVMNDCYTIWINRNSNLLYNITDR